MPPSFPSAYSTVSKVKYLSGGWGFSLLPTNSFPSLLLPLQHQKCIGLCKDLKREPSEKCMTHLMLRRPPLYGISRFLQALSVCSGTWYTSEEWVFKRRLLSVSLHTTRDVCHHLLRRILGFFLANIFPNLVFLSSNDVSSSPILLIFEVCR